MLRRPLSNPTTVEQMKPSDLVTGAELIKEIKSCLNIKHYVFKHRKNFTSFLGTTVACIVQPLHNKILVIISFLSGSLHWVQPELWI